MLRKLKDRFENDPHFQVRFNLIMTYLWMFQMFAVVLVFFLLPGLWASASILYLVVVSLWANMATHYGAVAAAEANENTDEDN